MCIGKHICRHKKTNSKKDIRALPKRRKYLKVYDDTWHNFIYGFMLCQFTINLCHQIYIKRNIKYNVIVISTHSWATLKIILNWQYLKFCVSYCIEIYFEARHLWVLWGFVRPTSWDEIRKVFVIIELGRTLNESISTSWEPFWLILHNFMAISRIIIAQLC